MSMAGSVILKDDGQMGPRTRQAYSSLKAGDRAVLENLVSSLGYKWSDLIFNEEKGLPPTSSEVRDAITAACGKFGVSVPFALNFAAAESRMNPAAYNKYGGAIGLFQITKSGGIAQFKQDNPKRFAELGTDYFDVKVNSEIGVYYMLWCCKRARVSPMTSEPRDWADVYGHYNLGTGAYALLKQGKYEDPIVKKSLATQAAILQRGGASAYPSNVLAFLQQSRMG